MGYEKARHSLKKTEIEIIQMINNKKETQEDSKIDQLANQGYCILNSVFDQSEVEHFRATTLKDLGVMGQTRNTVHSFHLAGFHRFPEQSAIHAELVSNLTVNSFLTDYYDRHTFYAIGLSDITINRSQQWHTDLLRGKFSHYLQGGIPWQNAKQSCIKALVYLQSSKSLRIVPGSHLSPSPLDDSMLDELAKSKSIVQLELNAGDVVMMDIRALHRGSTDEEMSDAQLAQNPKILLSTVFGAINSEFTQAMQLGNAHRMIEWDRKYLT